MCIYDGIFGSGAVLAAQALTLLTVLAAFVFWVWAYLKGGVSPRRYAPAIAFWLLFGTLDILITTRGIADGHGEGNTLAAGVFSLFGAHGGPAVASVLWISLWAGLVLALNRHKVARAKFLSLAVFYSLAAGHFFGFSSWLLQLCGAAQALDSFAPGVAGLLVFAAVGCAAALLDMFLHGIGGPGTSGPGVRAAS